MIALLQHISDSEFYNHVWQEYDSMIPESDKELRCGRGWDYGAIMKYGQFMGQDIVVDVGGATSYLFIYLANFVKEVWCVDQIFVNQWATDWMKSLEHYQSYIEGRSRIHIQNARRLPFPDNSIDKVVTCSSMEHFEKDDDTDCAIEIGRILKPGGLFLGTVDFNWYDEYMPEKYGEARFYTYESFIRRILLPSGLQINGTDFMCNSDAPEKTSENQYGIAPLFFVLRKS